MTLYTFSMTLDGLDVGNTDQLSKLHTEAFEILPAEIDGVVTVDVEIEASSGEAAVQTLINHLTSALPEVRIVRLGDDLVNASDIAERLEVKREAVRLWATGARGTQFPQPRAILSGGQRVWAWAPVHAWAEATGRLPADLPLPLDEACVDWFNGQLASHQRVMPSVAAPRYKIETDRRHGIASTWPADPGAHDAFGLDEFDARDGAKWVHDGVTMLQTGQRLRTR